MTDEDDGKPTLSDWITFLSSEKNLNTNNIFSLMALLVAVLAILFTAMNGAFHTNWVSFIVALVVLILIGVYFIQIVRKIGLPFQRHAREAEKLLDSIMLGKLKDPSEIEKKWRKATRTFDTTD